MQRIQKYKTRKFHRHSTLSQKSTGRRAHVHRPNQNVRQKQRYTKMHLRPSQRKDWTTQRNANGKKVQLYRENRCIGRCHDGYARRWRPTGSSGQTHYC